MIWNRLLERFLFLKRTWQTARFSFGKERLHKLALIAVRASSYFTLFCRSPKKQGRQRSSAKESEKMFPELNFRAAISRTFSPKMLVAI
jgi:hypothetical protein